MQISFHFDDFLRKLKWIFSFTVIAEREEMLLQLQQNQARSSGGAWWDRMKSFASTASVRSTENIPQLKQDVLTLEELSRQLFLEIHSETLLPTKSQQTSMVM